eukprot:1821462-Pleurochrysis_carterae.AAC.1
MAFRVMCWCLWIQANSWRVQEEDKELLRRLADGEAADVSYSARRVISNLRLAAMKRALFVAAPAQDVTEPHTAASELSEIGVRARIFTFPESYSKQNFVLVCEVDAGECFQEKRTRLFPSEANELLRDELSSFAGSFTPA